LADALDLFQHWILTEAGLGEDMRKQIMNEWIGELHHDRSVPVEDEWAPAWWRGDEEAAMTSRMAAMTLDAARNRR
jgi:hypothetical protein